MTALAADWMPTEAQRQLIEGEGSRFVEACPGSGKTRAIVARYERLASRRQRRGVALLSFTNAAVDEVTVRCSDPSILGSPNFVGTFDSFINRFVTGPYVAKATGVYPRFIDSWASIPGARVRVPSMQQGLDFNLDWFDWEDHDSFTLDRRRVRGKFTVPLLNAYEASSGAIDAAANALRRRLVKDRQIISCSASRHLAMRLLANPSQRATWTSLLASRFAELIVDEAQDSGAEELEVLRVAVEGRLSIVMVADLDQSIYEFRRAIPDGVRSFAQLIPAGSPLTGNFRSTPAVCSVGASLRVGKQRDEAVGLQKDLDWPVWVVGFAAPAAMAAALPPILDEHGLDGGTCMVLAHRRTDAAAASGAVISKSTAGHKVLRLARAHLAMVADFDPMRVRRSIGEVERILLEVAAPASSNDLSHTGDLAADLGISERWLRTAALRVVRGADPSLGRSAYAAEVRRIVQGIAWPNGITLDRLGNRLPAPPQAKWDELVIDPPAGLPWGTIHSAKGREFEAVALVIPEKLVGDDEGKTCLDHWEAAADAESRRVLYVGATRAQRLLVVAVHDTHLQRVVALLGGCNVQVADAARLAAATG